MYSLVILLTVLGVTREVPLRSYYETARECQEMKMALVAAMEPHEGVEGSIKCVSGWKVSNRSEV